jgi:hypothetical protein
MLLGYEEFSQPMGDKKSDAIVPDDAGYHRKQHKNSERPRDRAATSHTPLDQSL